MVGSWRRCSACKSDIAHAARYWVCSVSTCNRARTALAFCSVDCWEIHLPTERHRDAWAVEKRAPGEGGASGSGSVSGRPNRAAGAAHPPEGHSRQGRPQDQASRSALRPTESNEADVLVVASKLKKYVRDRSGFNTSDRVMLVLSDVLRRLCSEAIRSARQSGRDTVLDRDVPAED